MPHDIELVDVRHSIFTLDVDPMPGGFGYVIRAGGLIVRKAHTPIECEWEAFEQGQKAKLEAENEADLLAPILAAVNVPIPEAA